MINKSTIFAFAAGVLAFASLPQAQAATLLFHVTVDTAPLTTSPNGPFSLDFQLNDGSGSADGNNTATLSNFTFGGGAATGSPTYLGGVTGDISSSLTFSESNAFNEFFQGFTAGTSLAFDVAISRNTDAGITPDSFIFSILDSTLGAITTSGPAGQSVQFDITSPIIGVDAVQSFNGNGDYTGVNASVVPEPSANLLALASIFGVLTIRRRK
jgi:hypothetical protein